MCCAAFCCTSIVFRECVRCAQLSVPDKSNRLSLWVVEENEKFPKQLFSLVSLTGVASTFAHGGNFADVDFLLFVTRLCLLGVVRAFGYIDKIDAWTECCCIRPKIQSCVTTPDLWTTRLSSDAARTTTCATEIWNLYCTSATTQVIKQKNKSAAPKKNKWLLLLIPLLYSELILFTIYKTWLFVWE